MSTYRVNLEVFAGPLDLLLYLVKKEEVDIYDIPITKITDQYLKYIEMLKSLDIEVAGEFLVMAASLMQIKSAMLLPKADPDEMDEDEAIDPRSELIKQLLEYKKFKDAANYLHEVNDHQKKKYTRPDTILKHVEPEKKPELDLEDVSIWTLLESFDAIMQATGHGFYRDYSHIKDDTPIDQYQIRVLEKLQAEGPMTFERIFEGKKKKMVMVGMFLAMLELVRNKLIWLNQPQESENIYVKALTDEPAEKAVQNAIIATEEEQLLKEQQRKEIAEGKEVSVKDEPETGYQPAEEKAPEKASETDFAEPENDTEKTDQPSEQSGKPPIPIAELPPKKKSESKRSNLEKIK